jgi:hypothetical protein
LSPRLDGLFNQVIASFPLQRIFTAEAAEIGELNLDLSCALGVLCACTVQISEDFDSSEKTPTVFNNTFNSAQFDKSRKNFTGVVFRVVGRSSY